MWSQDGSREQVGRADRILAAAGELLLRFGYKRVTIEDIANQAEVGKGTVYLHWNTKQELFAELLLREVTEVTRELVASMRADPTGVLLHRVTSVSFQAIMQRPLARALYTRDLDTLGKLAASETAGVAARQQVAGALFDEYVDLLRAHGLLRTDIDRQAQNYVLNAVGTGFFVTEQFLPEQLQEISLEHKAAALAEVIRLALEPPGEPDPDTLRSIAPRAIELFDRMCVERDPATATSHSNYRSNDDN
ncbi:MAG TPA: helix-turn-helix domain-containing protein [Pseudonocardiaceae bacterium]|nr:helix-turn-helix domain-containing protein [Pseudonocardiaceae bacterium]